jgi:hypothetical protein
MRKKDSPRQPGVRMLVVSLSHKSWFHLPLMSCSVSQNTWFCLHHINMTTHSRLNTSAWTPRYTDISTCRTEEITYSHIFCSNTGLPIAMYLPFVPEMVSIAVQRLICARHLHLYCGFTQSLSASFGIVLQNVFPARHLLCSTVVALLYIYIYIYTYRITVVLFSFWLCFFVSS